MAAKRSTDDLLKAVPLFEGLTKSQLKRVRRECRAEQFRPGRRILVEGRGGGPFFLIVEGKVKVTRGGRTLKRLGPGAYFGEMSIIDGGPRSATVETETDVRALTMTSTRLLRVLQKNWPITRKVLTEMSLRIRSLERSLGH